MPAEFAAARDLFRTIVDELRAAGVAAALPELGIMVVTACDRTNGALGALIDPLNPGLLELIRRTAEHGRRQGSNVSLCGDMAGDPRCHHCRASSRQLPRSARRRPVTEPALEDRREEGAVVAYKSIFKAVLDNRPSGMRLRLALAMGKNRSFISQISSSAYQIPIPAQHLSTIFEVCHFSPAEKAAFLEAYDRAHPRRTRRLRGTPRERTVTLQLPDLGSQKRNGQLDALLHDFARRLNALLQEDK